MWRLLCATQKFEAKGDYQDLSFSCGADLKEANLPVNENALHAMIQNSANYDPVCIYCVSGDDIIHFIIIHFVHNVQIARTKKRYLQET